MIDKQKVEERINKYLNRCGENGDDFIAQVNFVKESFKSEFFNKYHTQYHCYRCSYCNNLLAFEHNVKLPNFCPECGCLLDWTNVYGKQSSNK